MFYYRKTIFLLLLFSVYLKILPEGFVAGTLVKTKYSYIPIETIKENDLVLTYNFKNKTIEEAKIKSIKINHSSSCISLIVNNTEIVVSPSHKFYCPMNKKRWTLAKDIKTGDYILRNIKDLIKIDKTSSIESNSLFYSLSIEKNHNFFISSQDIFVHNFAVTIPIFTWVIGEGITWIKGGAVLAAAGAWILNKIFQDEDIDCSGLKNIGDVTVHFNNVPDQNKFHHIINNADHGFHSNFNLGGPDPNEWWKRIIQTYENAKKNPQKLQEGKNDISTKWKSVDPNFGELVVRVFKVKNIMTLSTAFLRRR